MSVEAITSAATMTWNPDIAGILEDVVHQFSDPHAFFRELVQNAIDAGTGEVEIDVERSEDLTVATVRDFGCGMTREIIETQLCRLFSSDKYQDYTKIGRFGIGFVSVYGIEPEWVCVDTGREGQSWRVLFLPDRSFELRALREPCEGTTVRVAKRMSSDEHATFLERAAERVARWCAHVHVRIMFGGRDLRAPFEVDSPCAIEFEEEGTRVVAGLTLERSPTCRYYNRGLLLRERENAPWPHVVFKIDSRFLEHTLTRDDLLHDAGYHRAVELLEGLATKRLPALLLQELEDLADGPPTARRAELLHLFAVLARAGIVDGFDRRRILPTMSGPQTPRACERAESVLFAQTPSPLAEALAEAGHTVVIGPPAELGPILRQRGRSVDDEFLLLAAQPLRHAELDRLVGSPVWIGNWRGPRVVQTPDPLRPLARSAARPSGEGAVVLNADDETVRAALDLLDEDVDVAVAALAVLVSPQHAGVAGTWLARNDRG